MELAEEFDAYAVQCKSALRVAMAAIVNARELMEQSDERSLFDSIDSRLKTFESTVGKCDERGYELTMESIKARVRDIAGIRIITPFRDDVARVVDILEHIPSINIEKKKDYVEEPKANGYSSVHLNALVQIYVPDSGSKLIPVEIQVRDKAMDLWATLEHIVGYKNDNPSPEVGERFKRVSDVLAEFDRMAIELRDFEPQ